MTELFNMDPKKAIKMQMWLPAISCRNPVKTSSVCDMVIAFVEDLFVGFSDIYSATQMSKMRPRRKQWPQNVVFINTCKIETYNLFSRLGNMLTTGIIYIPSLKRKQQFPNG